LNFKKDDKYLAPSEIVPPPSPRLCWPGYGSALTAITSTESWHKKNIHIKSGWGGEATKGPLRLWSPAAIHYLVNVLFVLIGYANQV